MKHLLLTTIASVLLLGCGESQQSAPAQEAKPVKPVAEAEQADPPTAKAPDISIWDAVKTGNIEAVKQHLDAGAGVNGKDEDGYTPLDWAIFIKDTETAELLRKHGGKHGTIHSAAYGGDIEAVKKFLAAGTDVNAKHYSGRTPLHWAADKGHKEIAELLIAEGEDGNAKTTDGETPLDWAIIKDHTEIINLLRKHGGKTGEELKAEGK